MTDVPTYAVTCLYLYNIPASCKIDRPDLPSTNASHDHMKSKRITVPSRHCLTNQLQFSRDTT